MVVSGLACPSRSWTTDRLDRPPVVRPLHGGGTRSEEVRDGRPGQDDPDGLQRQRGVLRDLPSVVGRDSADLRAAAQLSGMSARCSSRRRAESTETAFPGRWPSSSGCSRRAYSSADLADHESTVYGAEAPSIETVSDMPVDTTSTTPRNAAMNSWHCFYSW